MKQQKDFRDTRFMRIFYKIEDAVTILSLSAILILTFYNVVLRFVFRTSSLWSDELISVLMVLMAMLGMAIGVKENSHSSLESLVCKLPAKLQSAVYIFDGIIVAIFLGVAVYGSFQFLGTVQGQKMVILPWPVSIVYSFVLLGCVLALFEHTVNVIAAIRKKECRFISLEEQMENESKFEQGI